MEKPKWALPFSAPPRWLSFGKERICAVCYNIEVMLGFGMGELIVIAIVALLFLGPDKLPAAAKKVSEGIRDLKRVKDEVGHTLKQDPNIREAVDDLQSALGNIPASSRNPMVRRVPTAGPAGTAAEEKAGAKAKEAAQPAPEAADPGKEDSGQTTKPAPGIEAPARPRTRMVQRVPKRRRPRTTRNAAAAPPPPAPEAPDSEAKE